MKELSPKLLQESFYNSVRSADEVSKYEPYLTM